jgi:hypothetical protein
MERCGLDACGPEQGTIMGSCECGNEPLGSVKGGEFLMYVRNWFANALLNMCMYLFISIVLN